jgi:hypothetical protein
MKIAITRSSAYAAPDASVPRVRKRIAESGGRDEEVHDF